MFEGFSETRQGTAVRGIGPSALAAAGLYAGVIGLGVVFSKPLIEAAEEKLIEVTLQRPSPPAPAAAAPPPPRRAPPAPRAPALVAPVAEVVAPKEVPTEEPPAAEPGATAGLGADAYGTDLGAVAGLGAQAGRAPINLPEQATPPAASAGNAPPEYPDEARAKGLEGQVVLKVVISESGEVTQVEVLRGESPFVEAARRAVARWTYRPAELDGQPIAVFRIIKIPFRLSLAG